MIHIKDKKDCCGCNACGDICPVDAIGFETDIEGFWYPATDVKKCINCGKCEQVCPVIHVRRAEVNEGIEPECYAGVHKSTGVVFSSTSGGIFSALAEIAYKRGGYVGGAVHNEDFSVSHFLSKDREDIAKLRRSKDLQSNAEGFYRNVKELLDAGEFVLVCGVPCQMAALRLFLGKEYSNLVIVDLVCLGVNSPKVWRKYLDFVESKYESKIVSTENKSKEFGWHDLVQKFTFENGVEAFDTKDTSIFTRGYLNTGLYCRPSCYDCKFKKIPRVADISIGDFWGIEKHDIRFNNDLGTSLIIVNSQKGKLFFEETKRRLVLKQVPIEWALSGNPALTSSIETAMSDRGKFFDDLDILPFDQVVSKYEKKNSYGIKWRLKSILRPVWHMFKFIVRIVFVTRMHPRAIYQTIRYSGIKNLIHQKGILCSTHCTINIAKDSELKFGGVLLMGGKGRFPKSKEESRLLVAKGARLIIMGDIGISYGADIEVFENAELIFQGSKHGKSDINMGCTIICGERIEIGADVAMGRNVLIRDTNGEHYMNTSGYRTSKPIVIGSKVWLCESCTVLPGVKIGRGGIVGAKSVVMNSVPAHALVSGFPARIVEENVLWKC